MLVCTYVCMYWYRPLFILERWPHMEAVVKWSRLLVDTSRGDLDNMKHHIFNGLPSHMLIRNISLHSRAHFYNLLIQINCFCASVWCFFVMEWFCKITKWKQNFIAGGPGSRHITLWSRSIVMLSTWWQNLTKVVCASWLTHSLLEILPKNAFWS